MGTQNEMVTALIVEATEDEHFALMLVQAEMERAKFLLRSYLRTRLAKVNSSSLCCLRVMRED